MTRAGLPRRHLQPPRHLRREVAERQTEAVLSLLLGRLAARVFAALAAAALGIEIELLDGRVQRLLLAVPHRPSAPTDVPGLVAVTIFCRSVVVVTGRPLNSMTTSPGLDAGLFRRTARRDLRDQRARARLEAEVLIAVARDGRHRQADPAADHLAVAAAAAAVRGPC